MELIHACLARWVGAVALNSFRCTVLDETNKSPLRVCKALQRPTWAEATCAGRCSGTSGALENSLLLAAPRRPVRGGLVASSCSRMGLGLGTPRFSLISGTSKPVNPRFYNVNILLPIRFITVVTTY